MNFTKLVHVTLDLISVYNIYKFQVNHLKNKRDLGHRKSRKWKVFRRLPEVDESVSGRSNIFWHYKRHSFNWYRFFFVKQKFWNFRFFYHFRWRPEVTVDTLIPPTFVYYSSSITSENFKSLSITIFENILRTRYLLKKRKTAIFTDRKWIF